MIEITSSLLHTLRSAGVGGVGVAAGPASDAEGSKSERVAWNVPYLLLSSAELDSVDGLVED